MLGKHFVRNYPDGALELQNLQQHEQQCTGDQKSSKTGASREAISQFMRGVMDEFTHLGNFPKPVDPTLIICVVAANDAYVPRDSVADLNELWPEAEVRYIPKKGHVGAWLFDHGFFRSAVADGIWRMARKHYACTLASFS